VDNTFEAKLFCLLFHALPIRRAGDRKMMEIRQPLKALPGMVGGVYGEVQKFPLRREAVRGRSETACGLRFCPEVRDCGLILGGMLYQTPVELDDCGTADVVAPESVVAPVAEVEFTKEGVVENIGIARGTN